MREVNTMSNDSHSSGFVMGLICGAAVGAAVGLLLAPKAGSELRHQIYETTGRLRKSAEKGYASAVESVSDVVDDVVERGKSAAQRGQETYESVKKSASQGAQQVKSAADRM
ncbi:MAG: YtxH domain-containing protein [Acidobacteria bacterium]|nr:YtxH domain-containing protein [Acidobacteriota bacterium]